MTAQSRSRLRDVYEPRASQQAVLAVTTDWLRRATGSAGDRGSL